MDEKVFQAVAVLERFLDLYKVEDEWIDCIATFYHTPKTLILTSLQTKRMRAFVAADSDLCEEADTALDVAMEFLLGECRKEIGVA